MGGGSGQSSELTTAQHRLTFYLSLLPFFDTLTEDNEVVGEIAAQSSELTALTLLLLAERAKGSASKHSALFASLPVSVCCCIYCLSTVLCVLCCVPLSWSDFC